MKSKNLKLSFILRSWCCLTAMAVMSATGLAQSSEKKRFEREAQKSCQLIAMLSIDYKGTPVFGAGIIVGRQKDSLLIATAYHLIHYGDMQPNSIGVRLKTKPDVLLNATILKYPDDKKMDLAILRVKDNFPGGKCGMAFKQLSDDERERGDKVFAVGNPNGVSWVIPVDADKIVQASKNEIVFQSAFISIGNSGGGLLDEDGHFIGMITSDQAPYGRAIDIADVLDQVKRWGYRVELGTPEKPYTSTALHLAAKNGDKTEVKYLLENCADPNALNENHETTLLVAVRARSIEVIPLLLKAGADIERPGWTLGLWRPLNIAIQTGRIDIVNLLLKAGANPKGRFGYAYTLWPLGSAIDSGNIEIIKTLLAAGADINETDETGNGALYHAVFHKAKSFVIKSLLDVGANPNGYSEKDIHKSPLGCAAYLSNIEAMQLLVEAGANINIKDKNGHTPLWFAMQERSQIGIDWLRAHGAKE